MPRRRAEFLVLALDIGSSSTRSALYDNSGDRLTTTDAARKYLISYTPEGGAELSPHELLRAIRSCCAHSLAPGNRSFALRQIPVRAGGASAFWHGLLGLNGRGRPITPIYTWADSRSAHDARALREKVSEKDVHSRTGCMIHASFWPAKLRWLRRTNLSLFRRVARWVSPVDWAFTHCFGVSASSLSMASATGLYDWTSGAWDKELCALCRVKPAQLPDLEEEQGSSGRIPRIFTAIGDGAASNLGSGADRVGTVAINVGTSAAIRLIRASNSSPHAAVPLGLFRYALDSKRVVIGGAVSNAGNLRQWALRELHIADNARTNRAVYSRQAAAHDHLSILPFWAGERAPTWPDDQLGVIDGLTQATRSTDILRAMTTSVFYRLADILSLLETSQRPLRRIIVSGGILRSLPEVRLLADAIGRDVELACTRESSLRGAALYVLQQLGVMVSEQPRGKLVKHKRELAADHSKRRARQKLLESALAAPHS